MLCCARHGRGSLSIFDSQLLTLGLSPMSPSLLQNAWGQPPWRIDFSPAQQPFPDKVDFAIIGGGFTGLAAAAWLRLHAPDKSVLVLESGRIGGGASGRPGGMVLAE